MDFWLGGVMGSGGSLTWTAPQWVILVVITGCLIAWAASMIGKRAALARVVEVTAWGAALLGMAVALAGPVWVEEEGRSVAGRLAVVVDGSRSMSVMEEGAPRHEAVEEILTHIERTNQDVDIYHFGDDLAIGTPDGYDLSGTDLEGALDALSERVAGEKLAGVVVLTDGLDRGLLRRRFEKEESPAAPSVPGPLTVYQIGKVGDVLDLAVRSVDSGGYAFIRSPFKISATVDGLGYENRRVTSTLWLDGAPLMTEDVVIGSDGKAVVSFDVVPEEAGRFTYSVSLPVYEGDAVPANNTLPIAVKVVRDRIRVLQVAGAPSWDVKFLRRFLKGDPSVQLVSFFILRTQRDLMTSYDDRELSLIAFPYKRLFDQDLWSFDVVIFQNFDHQPYFSYDSQSLLKNIAEYVEEGGALVMIGGDRSFGLGRYGGTAVSDVLPVTIPRQTPGPDLSQFTPQLTDEGVRHPLTRLAGDAIENGEWWARMSPMDGTNVVTGAKPDAAVLLTHPTQTTVNGEPLPILSVREVGAGRTMALTVDSSWRWSLSEAAQGRGNQAYLRFWKNAIRWLMKDTTVARVTVDTPRENYAVGDDVRIITRVRDPGFAPMERATVKAEIDAAGHTMRLKGQTNADGEIILSLPAERRGTHRITVVADSEETGEVGTATTVFAVTTRDPELDEVSPDETFLLWLAGSTGGKYFGPGQLGAPLTDPDAGRVVWERTEISLWRAPALALWIVMFAGLAWIIRRRSGLR